MVFLKFVAAVAFIMFYINYAMGNTEKFYDALREQAASCNKGKSYEIEADGCRNSCECIALGVMKCDETECATGEDDSAKEGSSTSIFDSLRDEATTCTEGQQVEAEGCGTCTCVITGILNCQFKAACLPSQARKHRRNDVANVIIG